MKKIWSIIVAIGSAILLAIAASSASAKREAAKKKEDLARDLMKSSIKKDLDKAKELSVSAAKDKLKAEDAKQSMKKHLEKLGESSEDLDAVAHEFNSRRLRKRPRSPDPKLGSRRA